MARKAPPAPATPHVDDDRALDALAEALDSYYGIAGDLARARVANTVVRAVVFVPDLHRTMTARAIGRMITSLERSLRVAQVRVLKLAQEQRSVRE